MLAAQHCIKRASCHSVADVRQAQSQLIDSLKSHPAINGTDLDAFLQLIAKTPESSDALRGCRKIAKIARYAGPDADLAAQELLDTMKQARDGHYCIAQEEILIRSKTKKTILICEDMRDFREEFVKNHKDEHHVISLDKLEYVQPVLSY